MLVLHWMNTFDGMASRITSEVCVHVFLIRYYVNNSTLLCQLKFKCCIVEAEFCRIVFWRWSRLCNCKLNLPHCSEWLFFCEMCTNWLIYFTYSLVREPAEVLMRMRECAGCLLQMVHCFMKGFVDGSCIPSATVTSCLCAAVFVHLLCCRLLPSNRQHLSCDDCLEVTSED